MIIDEYKESIVRKKLPWYKFDDIMEAINDDNKANRLSYGVPLHGREIRIHEDTQIGRYETLVISKFEEDGHRSPHTEIIFTDDDGNIMPIPGAEKLKRQISIQAMSEDLESRMRNRKIELQAYHGTEAKIKAIEAKKLESKKELKTCLD